MPSSRRRVEVPGLPPGVAASVDVVPFGERFEIPTWFEYSGGGPFKWTMRVDIIDGQPRCTALGCEANEGGFVSAADLHRFPLGLHVEDATTMAAKPVDDPTFRAWESVEQAREAQAAVARTYRQRRRGRDTRTITDDQLDEVARIYLAHEPTGKPTDAVAEQLHLARSTAGRWVMKARAAGKIPPARRSKEGTNA